ncbi:MULTISPECIES: glycosyltransferase family 4 protein [Salimicrobium]|uniref:Glycosyl transferase n=4 Tax=Salimicrobium TaxID=351195 RepID=K2GCH8_9BACI|nr:MULTISPECIES: glycosyltransferase family 1 protein [Salimicrobium]AKG04484.1 glycosyl transferase [Salimicrobium jeotgali]EKE32693.1 group 1 glycosyltransferase [Salimicrobium jeotgali]MBM7695321.1 glycosyltransferase involved in cell wall biosynthesis [Salimicrobium jeotgali]PBB04849.1 glycosyltransferase family 1 protein [Salimicrobium humidisoli]SDX28175.1 Glycosyltransferase involved in cell wall bisynthesis [Salimicrobium album]
MKIVIVTETFLPSTDGVVTRLKEAITYIHKKGHEVVIIAPDLGVKEFDGAIVEGIKPAKLPVYSSKYFSLPSRKVKDLLEKHNPDVVHVVNPALVGVSGVYYANKLGFPLVASYHTHVPKYLDYYNLYPFKPIFWAYFKKLHSYAHTNVCTSQTILKELQQKRIHNLEVWKRGVAIDHFHPKHESTSMRERLSNGNPGDKLLVFVGRLAPEKEIHKIKPLLEKRKDVSLAIIGDGPIRQQLEKEFEGTKTVFTGNLHGEEFREAFASGDAMIFPSVTETLGLVILEAMASGLPVIAAESGPTKEQVVDGETGILFENENTQSMIDAVEQLEDPELLEHLSENARKEAENFSWEKPSEQILEIYKKTIAIAK